MVETVLEAQSLTREFGGLVAVDDISVSFGEGSIHAVIGPNGAGKTTLFNLMTGGLSPTAGTIMFRGQDITRSSPDEIVDLGLARSFQISELLEGLTALENVRTGVLSGGETGNLWRSIDDYEDVNERSRRILARMGLSDVSESPARDLSHGERRMLDIGVALATEPDMLLLDEPAAGLSPEETTGVIGLIGDLAESFPVVLTEHKMSVVRQLADHIVVMNNGRVIADGKPKDVRANEEVKRAYLGDRKL